MQYIVVRGGGGHFQKIVEERLADGYQLQGGVSVSICGQYATYKEVYAQAMTKEE